MRLNRLQQRVGFRVNLCEKNTNYTDRCSPETVKTQAQQGIDLKFFARFLSMALPTMIVGINPVPKTAPWRFDGPPTMAILFNCLLIAIAIGFSVFSLRTQCHVVIKLVSIACLLINAWFAVSLIQAYT